MGSAFASKFDMEEKGVEWVERARALNEPWDGIFEKASDPKRSSCLLPVSVLLVYKPYSGLTSR